ncbi:MAG: hypothetical protein IJ867_03905 [Clostridia bacterium]|nr:hypothetical protein [Clostridia bacterium]
MSRARRTTKNGDIVTYLENDYLVTHRIVEKDDDRLITKGDSNNEVDREINEDKVLGKVIFHSLVLGNFVRVYLKYVFIAFTLIVIGINLHWGLRERKKDERSKGKENQ